MTRESKPKTTLKRGRVDQIDRHPQRAQIDFAIACGIEAPKIARKYGVHYKAVERRKKKLPPQMLAAMLYRTDATHIDLEALRKSESEGILQHLVCARGQIYDVMTACYEAGDFHAFWRGDARLSANLELTAKLLGDLSAGDVHMHVHLTSSPEYLRLRASLISILRRYPEVMAEVAEALRTIEAPVERPMITVNKSNGHAGATDHP